MNGTGASDAKGYAIARSALFDALLALAPLPEKSFVLVGAQAVYLRAPEEVIPSIPAFTLDGDLVADPLKLRRPRLIIEHLERGGFALLCMKNGPAIMLLREALGAVTEVELIAESLAALVDEFCTLVEEAL